jgi:effector-binding domain-containing protein
MAISEVQLHQVPAVPVAVVRRQAKTAELSRVVPQCCGIVWNALRAQHARGGRHVAIYLGKEDRVEIGAELIDSFTEQGEVLRSATPSGVVASLAHFGPYHTLGVAHEAIHAWSQRNGHPLAGPSWEIYGHWLEAWNNDPSQIRTDVFYLVGNVGRLTSG